MEHASFLIMLYLLLPRSVEQINAVLLRLNPDEQQRSAMKEACWMEAQRIMSDYWPAVGTLAMKLLERGHSMEKLPIASFGKPSAILMLIGDSELCICSESRAHRDTQP